MRFGKIFGALIASPVLFLVGNAVASDINNLKSLNQQQFKDFSRDITSALSYKAVEPATNLGITGFDASLGVSVVRMKNSNVWQQATGTDVGFLPIPKLQISKGLPFGIDISGFYTAVPTTNIHLYGAALKYSILEGTAVTPALAIRGTYTKLDGVDQLGFDSKGLELLVSKGFLGITPYAGVGVVNSNSTAHLPAPFASLLSSVNQTESKVFAGINWNILIGNLALEYDRTGNNDTLSAKIGIRW